jgi:hypothetical protein
MKSNIFTLAFAALSVALAVAPAHARASKCDPAYAVQVAEASATARASAQAAALTSLITEVKGQVGDKTGSTVKAKVDGRYAVAAAGGMAQNAYAETARSYFCFLKEAAAKDPAQLAIISKEEKAFRIQVVKYFDPGLWQLEQIEKRAEVGDALVEEAAQPPLLSAPFVTGAIPTFSFDTVKLYQITADATIADAASASVCGGIVKRSIKRVSPTVLANLQLVRATVVAWLSGDRAEAKLDMWEYTAGQMTNLLASSTSKEEFEIKPDTIACLEKVRDDSQKEAAAPTAPKA